MTQKKPIGQRIRDVINPALEDKRCKEIQLGILSEFFEMLAIALPKALEDSATDFFNKVASKTPEERNPYVIRAITKILPGMPPRPEYSPIIRPDVLVASAFTDFNPMDIKELPSYILLHEVLRAQDVAIKFIGLTSDEARGMSGLLPPIAIIDASKSYEQGAMESGGLYPDLPPIPEEFDPTTPQVFKVEQRKRQPGQG